MLSEGTGGALTEVHHTQKLHIELFSMMKRRSYKNILTFTFPGPESVSNAFERPHSETLQIVSSQTHVPEKMPV